MHLNEGTKVKVSIDGLVREAIVIEAFSQIYPARTLLLDSPVAFRDQKNGGMFASSWSADSQSPQNHWENLAAMYNGNAYTDTFWFWDGNTILLQILDPDSQSEVETLRAIPVAAKVGFNCKLCNNRNDFAESNTPDGQYVCYNCR